MSILKPYTEAGVLTFTVRNNEAIAANRFPKANLTEEERAEWKNHTVIDYAKWKAINDLPPLPTSGIPDGPVKIEEVEEQFQVKALSKWIDDDKQNIEWCIANGYEARIALCLINK